MDLEERVRFPSPLACRRRSVTDSTQESAQAGTLANPSSISLFCLAALKDFCPRGVVDLARDPAKVEAQVQFLARTLAVRLSDLEYIFNASVAGSTPAAVSTA
jgi:hypothetical protein